MQARAGSFFAYPRRKCGIHPANPPVRDAESHAGRQLLGSVLYLLSDDLRATIEDLKGENVQCSEVEEESWGLRTPMVFPGGSKIGLYQPKHPVAIAA